MRGFDKDYPKEIYSIYWSKVWDMTTIRQNRVCYESGKYLVKKYQPKRPTSQAKL